MAVLSAASNPLKGFLCASTQGLLLCFLLESLCLNDITIGHATNHFPSLLLLHDFVPFKVVCVSPE